MSRCNHPECQRTRSALAVALKKLRRAMRFRAVGKYPHAEATGYYGMTIRLALMDAFFARRRRVWLREMPEHDRKESA